MLVQLRADFGQLPAKVSARAGFHQRVRDFMREKQWGCSFISTSRRVSVSLPYYFALGKHLH